MNIKTLKKLLKELPKALDDADVLRMNITIFHNDIAYDKYFENGDASVIIQGMRKEKKCQSLN